MSPGSVRYWHDMTGPEVAARVGDDAVVVLPLGAVEQHGPHLPLSTDLDVARGIVTRAFRHLSGELEVWCLPAVAVGASQEHLGFSGTLSVTPGLLADALVEQGRALAGSGVRRLVLFSAHGGNRGAMEGAGLRLRKEEGLLVVRTSHFALPPLPDSGLPDREWRHGLHGGAVETAMMLHLHPGRVRMERAEPCRSLGEDLAESLKHVAPAGPAPFSWTAADLNPAGAVGDPTLADGELGRALVDHYGRLLAEVVEDTARFPLDRLS